MMRLSIRFDLRDALTAALLLGACAAIYAPWLATQNLNSDEAWYQAHASYLLDSDQSAFDTPLSAVYIIAFYEFFARCFCAYDIVPVRISIAAISFGTSWCIFRIARSVIGFPYAVLAGLLFLSYGVLFEGISANREWLAMPVLVLSLLVYLAAIQSHGPDVGWRALLLAGTLGGIAFWLKDQSIFLLLALPLDMGCRALAQRDYRLLLRNWVGYGAGIVIGLLCGALPLFVNGTLFTHVSAVANFEANRITSPGSTSFLEKLSTYWHGFFLDVPFHWLFVTACLAALLSLASSIRMIWSGAGDRDTPYVATMRVFSWYLLCSLIAIQSGGRFFRHYFLFALPAVALLCAAVSADLIDAMRRKRKPFMVWLLLGCLSLQAWLAVRSAGESSQFAEAGPYHSLPVLLICLAFAAAAVSGFLFRKRRLVIPAFALVSLAFLAFQWINLSLVATVYSGPMVLAQRFHYDFAPVIHWIAARSRHDDTLFVWGWRPEIYSSAGLHAASQFVTSTYIMADGSESAGLVPEYNGPRLELLLSELHARPPRFFIDTWAHSIFGARCRLKYYPPLSDFLRADYRLSASIDGCDIYLRRQKNEPSAPVPPALSHELQSIHDALTVVPNDPTVLLNLADLWAQEGQIAEARSQYAALRRQLPGWALVRNRLESLTCAATGP